MSGTLLVTAFEPFGGERVNASRSAVDALPERIGAWALVRRTLPVVFGEAARQVIRAAEETHADAVLCIGQAAGRSKVTPEMLGVNLRYAAIPDNAGHAPKDEPVEEGGPAAVFSTLPVRRMAQAICDAGLPGAVSLSAGAYVCNDVLYSVLRHFSGTAVRAGFVHVPALPGQNAVCLPAANAAAALCAAILAL